MLAAPQWAVADARLVEWLKAEGLPASLEALEALDAFERRLYETNREMNLTRVPRGEFWERHVVDSLLFQGIFPRNAQVLDIGSGPGFPAWPLALFRPDLSVTALDSSRKALRFLLGAALPNLEVVEGRAEQWGVREAFDVVTGRAVAPLAIQLELSAPPCRVGGIVAPMRTPADERSFSRPVWRRLGLDLEGVERRALPETGAERLMPVYRKARPTPRAYPRPWTEMRVKPLEETSSDRSQKGSQGARAKFGSNPRPR